MSIYKMGKIFLALLLSVGLAGTAGAATQTIYQSDDKTITVTADVTEKSVTYTDANGKEQTYTYSAIDNSTIEITVTGLVYDSPNGGTEEKYYAWTEDTDSDNAGTGNYTLKEVESSSNADITARYAESESKGIYNDGTSDYNGKNISADFVGDHHEYDTTEGEADYGGAIDNHASTTDASLGNITGNFIGDYESGSTSEYGGAISNNAEGGYTAGIGNIYGNFIGNTASTTNGQIFGGAIYNHATGAGSTAKIGNITGDFVGNGTSQSTNVETGGAIYNWVGSSSSDTTATAEIGDIKGNFIGNYIDITGTDTGRTLGGAIGNEAYYGTAKIGNITGDFVGNYTNSTGTESGAGAIFNRGAYCGTAQIGNITGNFIGNYTTLTKGTAGNGAIGGAIVNMAQGAEQQAKAIIGDITGDFIGNYAYSDSNQADGMSAVGGAIMNVSVYAGDLAKIGDITGNFIGNYAYSVHGAADSGAILNWTDVSQSGQTAQIGNITGNFIGNYTISESKNEGNCSASSGAIDNYAEAKDSTVIIGDITGDFIGNYAESAAGYTWAGAIANRAWADGATATIGVIQGDFIGNYAKATELYAYGGAIVNLVKAGTTGATAQIESIKNSRFIDNYASSVNDVSYGGAIYNQGYIGTADESGNVTVAGISNSLFSGNEADRGGAIYNGSEKTEGEEFSGTYTCILSSIENTSFVGNKADMFGGAIYNYDVGAIYKILNCYFEGNVASSGNGGAIENAEANSFIGAITNSYFKGNYVETGTHGGGAIYNEGIINSLTKNTFADNWSGNFGGALYNNGGTIGGDGSEESITGNYFSGNYSDRGGAIYNTKTRTLVTTELDTDGNVKTQKQIFDLDSYGSIMSIDGNSFVNNWANDYGGAIYNYHGGEIGSISNNYFEGNQAKGGNGGAVENAEFDTTIGNMDGNVFVKNSATGNGGAIYNQGTIGIERGDESSGDTVTGGISNSTFVENSATNGGAICNNAGSDTVYVFPGDGSSGNKTTLTDVDGNSYTVETNPVVGAGAIGDIVNCYFEGNTATENGGAIYNASQDIDDTVYTCTINSVTNSSFINNSAGKNGGAIYTTSDLSIVADGSQTGSTVVFQGNTDGTDDNAIYMAEAADGTVSNLSFSLTNGGTIFMYDNIKGEGNYSVEITGTGTENKFYLLNDVNAVSEVSPESVKPLTNDASEITTNNADLSVGGVSLYTTLYSLDDEAHTYKVNSFTVTKDFDMYADVDFANEVMDHFETSDDNNGEGKLDAGDGVTNGHGGTLNVAGLNGLTDTDADRVAIYFAEEGLMKNVTSSAGTVYAPVYTYDANYVYLDGEGDDQKIHYGDDVYDVADSELFSSGTYENAGYFVFDKTGYNPAVMATSMASMAAYGFMNMMYEYNFEHSDYYMKLPEDVRLAMNENAKNAKKAPKESDATRPEYYNQHELTYRGAWFRSFFSNESVNYGSGWNSRDKYWGAMVGFDSDMRVSKNGWANVTTGYIGTGGIRQQYSGGHIKQHGGFVGITESFYKKNFYTAWTIAAGSMKAHEHTMYGHDKDRIDDYGIAARFGWNIDMDYNGKFAILPTFTASYSYIHPEDFTNSADVKITGSGMRAVQLNPNVKFIWKMNDGWQPYLTLGEIWTVGESSHIRADSVKLPELDLKAYTEYGIGLQKRWADEKDAYIQLLGHSDGRDGILVNAGIRWNF